MRRHIVDTVICFLGVYVLIYGFCNQKELRDALVIAGGCLIALGINHARKKVQGLAKIVLTCTWYAGVAVFLLCEVCIVAQRDNIDTGISKAEYIAVAGSKLENNEITPMLQSRLDKAIELYKELQVPIIVSGGRLGKNEKSEAAVMREYILMKDPECAVIEETQAKDTRDNFQLIRQKIGEKNIVIVTSDFHMFRAKMLAKEAEFGSIYGVSAKTGFRDAVYYNIRETASIVREYVLRGLRLTKAI